MQKSTQPMVRLNVAKDEKLTDWPEWIPNIYDSLNKKHLSYTARALWLI